VFGVLTGDRLGQQHPPKRKLLRVPLGEDDFIEYANYALDLVTEAPEWLDSTPVTRDFRRTRAPTAAFNLRRRMLTAGRRDSRIKREPRFICKGVVTKPPHQKGLS
jgi:hypothetical protein